MLNLGAGEINKMYLGGTEAKKAYLGATKVYDKTGIPLPSNVVSWVDFRKRDLDYARELYPNLILGAPALSPSGISLNGSSGLAWNWESIGLPMSGDFTLEVFDVVVTNANGSIIGNEAGGTGTRSLHIYYRTSVPGFQVITGTTGTALVTTSVGGVPVGTPFHLCLERTGNTWRVYINGTQAATWSQSGTILDPGRSWYFGCRGSAGSRDFKNMSATAFRITDDALYSGNFTPPPAPTYTIPASIPEEVVYGVELLGGARTWFNSPNMIRDGDNVLFTSVSNTGLGVRLATWNITDDTVTVRRTNTTAGNDDHNEGAIIKLDNGNYLFASVAHNVGSFQKTIGTSLSSWTEANIAASLGVSNLSYSNLIQLEGETNDPIYLFGRGGDPWSSRYSVSTDGGATWGAYTIWCEDGGNRPYVQYWKTSDTRIDFILTEGHPNALATSVYHGYFEGGVFYKTDGTSAGSLPINPADFTLVFDGSADKAWVWDLKRVNGTLVALFASFPSVTAHRYHRAVLDDMTNTWSVETVVSDAGTYLYAAEPFYSGGLCCHQGDTDILFCSAPDASGIHQLFRYERDGGGTWTGTKLTAGLRPSFRPDTCDGALTYLHGNYTTYNAFSPVKVFGKAL